ncbi:patatin-like phospholipase family protein [Dactylosporangium sp. CA-052675]|uniref:patatin-like phospholipase family protein n=1 Tax=Dactylosporangium sp. CA-052675 TaxID=3239927 RepID=UPI003D8DABD6
MSQSHESHNLALVLGAGGGAGQAWVIGVVAGLAEAGFDLTESADLVIGTSSGATAAAWVRSGIPAADLFATILSEPVPPAGQRPAGPGAAEQHAAGRDSAKQHAARQDSAGPDRERPSARPQTSVFERMRAINAAATSAADLQRAMGAFGLEGDGVLDPALGVQRRAQVAARLPRPEWPDRPMVLVALDAHTGELVTFDRDSGVELADAVTAATALPGLVPTPNINGRRYINGGVRSADNADLASGYANVVVLAPFSVRNTPLADGQFEGLRRFPGTELDDQVERLREEGSHVEVIAPDAESRAAMGVNQMDPATRIPSARAGFAQGRREAAHLTLRRS